MRSFKEDMSCCTDCWAVLTSVVTACCVESSFADAFQPNPKPAIATKPSTMIAGNCQDEPFLVSMMCSSVIKSVFSSPYCGRTILILDRPVTQRLQVTSQRKDREQRAKISVNI